MFLTTDASDIGSPPRGQAGTGEVSGSLANSVIQTAGVGGGVSGFETFEREVRGRWVRVLVNNVSMNHPGGTRSSSLLHVLIPLMLWAMRRVLGIRPVYLSVSQNSMADYLSLSRVDPNV